MSEERWLPVPSWEGKYEISDQGRLRRTVRGRRYPAGSFLAGMRQHGYLWVILCEPGRRQRASIHALVLLAFVGPRPSGMSDINHKDGNKDNNNLTNLEYCTRAENLQHAYVHLGRTRIKPPRGADYWNAKLTIAQATEIRARYATGTVTQAQLATEFGVHQTTISYIVRRVKSGENF